MRYLLDTHIISDKLLNESSKRTDLYVIDEVVKEYVSSESEEKKITNAGIHIVKIEEKYLSKLTEVMTDHGTNLKLIRLYTGKGSADVLMLAYILSEMDCAGRLFTEKYTLVTKDKELKKVARSYGIKVVDSL